MTSLTLIWRSIRNPKGQITQIYDLENDHLVTKSASIVLYYNKTEKYHLENKDQCILDF